MSKALAKSEKARSMVFPGSIEIEISLLLNAINQKLSIQHGNQTGQDQTKNFPLGMHKVFVRLNVQVLYKVLKLSLPVYILRDHTIKKLQMGTIIESRQFLGSVDSLKLELNIIHRGK